MKCRKCGKHIMQVWGMWSPDNPNIARRGYLCRTCEIGYVELFDRVSQTVVGIEEKDLSEKKEVQTTLGDF